MPKKEISALQGFLFSFFELNFLYPSILLPQRLEGFPGITFFACIFFLSSSICPALPPLVCKIVGL